MPLNVLLRSGQLFLLLVNSLIFAPASLPADWSHYKGAYYKVFADWVTFPKAEEICRKHHAILSPAEDKDGLNFIVKLRNNTLYPVVNSQHHGFPWHTWLGATHEDKVEGDWMWTTGDPVNYTNWKTGEPSRGEGHLENCLAMTATGHWDDVYCSQYNFSFVCRFTNPDRDTVGVEFFLGFLEPDKVSVLELIIASATDTSAQVRIETPLFDASWSKEVTLGAGATQVVTLPNNINGEGVKKEGKAVWVQASREISVVAINKRQFSTGAYTSLPLDVLNTTYYVMTYQSKAALMIVATDNETNVTIQWTKRESSVSFEYNGTTYGPGDILSLTLDKFQTFHVADTRDDADFTGTYVTSSKPVAVISGNKAARVPSDSRKTSVDHLAEMMTPVITWGRDYVTSGMPGGKDGDVFRILASQNGTTVSVCGYSANVSLDAAQFEELSLPPDDPRGITADKPILVALFSKSRGQGGNRGDPSMTLLPALTDLTSNHTWQTVENCGANTQFEHRLSVVIERDAYPDLRVDCQPLQATEHILNISGCTMVQLWMEVGSPGNHTVSHTDPSVTFSAMASGTAEKCSYTFLLRKRVHVDGSGYNGSKMIDCPTETTTMAATTTDSGTTAHTTEATTTEDTVFPTAGGVSPTPKAPKKRQCPCRCTKVPPEKLPENREQLEEKKEQLKSAIQEELTEDKSKLSKTVRKRTSARDDRLSARYAGYLTIGVLVFVFGSIALADLLSVLRCIMDWIKGKKGNKRGRKGKRNEE